MRRSFSSELLFGVLLLALAAAVLAQDREHADAPDRGWIGLYIRDLQSDDVRHLDLRRGTTGVVVSGVDDQGPAARAGIRSGDVITEIDGGTVRDQLAFVREVRDHRAGERLRLNVLRDGHNRSFVVEITARDARPENAPPPPPSIPDRWHPVRPRLGVEVMDLDTDLAEYFGVDRGQGVLVTRVQENTGAARGGIKSGDVIVRVDDQPVHAALDLQNLVAEHRDGETILVVVRRRNHEQTLKVDIAELGPTLPEAPTFNMPGDNADERFGNDVEDLRRQVRDLKRQVDELEREVRTMQRR